MQNPHRARRPARQNLDSVRRYLITVTAGSTLCGSIAPARSDEVPNLDVRPICHGIASQSGESLSLGLATQFKQCVASEQEVHEQLKAEWRTFSAADKQHCGALIEMGGESSYTELLTCLEMARDVRALKSASSPPSSRTTVKRTAPAVSTQSSPATGEQPPRIKPPPSASELQRQLEQAKAEADTAKKLQEAALLKVADAEATLGREKEEAERLKTEAEQAKTAARSAKLAQASAERKLAELKAPLLQTEHRASEKETIKAQLSMLIIALSLVAGALAVSTVYLLRKLRVEKKLRELEAPNVVLESNSVDARSESVRPGAANSAPESS